MLVVDQLRQRSTVSFVPDEPRDQPGRSRNARIGAGFSHFGRTEAKRIGQYGSE